jgi:hypothetical protein
MGFCVLDVVRRLEVVTRLADDDRGFFGGFLRAHLQQSSGLVLVWYRGLFAWVFAWFTLIATGFRSTFGMVAALCFGRPKSLKTHFNGSFIWTGL